MFTASFTDSLLISVCSNLPFSLLIPRPNLHECNTVNKSVMCGLKMDKYMVHLANKHVDRRNKQTNKHILYTLILY